MALQRDCIRYLYTLLLTYNISLQGPVGPQGFIGPGGQKVGSRSLDEFVSFLWTSKP